MKLLGFLSIMLILAAVGFLALVAARAKRQNEEGDAPQFKQKPLLTANELEFLARLEEAVPELRFFPQVAMGAILDPAVPRSDGKEYFRLRGMFSQKIVDFVAHTRAGGQTVAIIELDDRTHKADKDARRDEMLKSAGYPIIRWNSRDKPDATEIRETLLKCSEPPERRRLRAA